MWTKEWVVLLVDDEPDVLQVSQLVMRRFDVYGVPLRIVTATGKGQAIELLTSVLSRQSAMGLVAVAIIDVVMETDAAGLELCEYIRHTLGNQSMQIYIRTGQPGVAPERAVMDRLDISGYYSKVEATEDKLYSMIKAGVKAFFTLTSALGYVRLMSHLIAHAHSRESLMAAWAALGPTVRTTASGQPVDHEVGTVGLLVDGEHIDAPVQLSRDECLDIIQDLDRYPGVPLGSGGDRYVTDEAHRLMIKLERQEGRAELIMVSMGAFQPPQEWITMTYQFLTAFATMWQMSASLVTVS